MGPIAACSATGHHSAEVASVRRAWTQGDHRWRIEDRLNFFESITEGRGSVEYSRVRHHPHEFVHARPRNAPRLGTLCEPLEEMNAGCMERRFQSGCVDQDVGINCYQSRSSIRSRRAFQSSRVTPGCKPPPCAFSLSRYLLLGRGKFSRCSRRACSMISRKGTPLSAAVRFSFRKSSSFRSTVVRMHPIIEAEA